jgi:hypothetical protein
MGAFFMPVTQSSSTIQDELKKVAILTKNVVRKHHSAISAYSNSTINQPYPMDQP